MDRSQRAALFWDWLMKAHADLLGAEGRVRSGEDGAAELAVSSAAKALQAIAALAESDPVEDPWEAVPAGWAARDLDLPLLRGGTPPEDPAAVRQVVEEARRLWEAVFWDQDRHGTDMDVED